MLFESRLSSSLCNPVKRFSDFISYIKWSRSSEVALLCVFVTDVEMLGEKQTPSDQTAPANTM